jgi:hypothetical protein
MNWLRRRLASMPAEDLMILAPIALASVAIALPAVDLLIRSI